MTKDSLIKLLQAVQDNFLIGLAMSRKMKANNGWTEICDVNFEFTDVDGHPHCTLPLAGLRDTLTDPGLRTTAIENYEKGLKRALVGEIYELIKAYCNQTHQYPKYKQQPWFHFACILRNVVSHNSGGVLTEWRNKSIHSVQWRGRTLAESMVGQKIPLSIYECLLLLDDQRSFVVNDLV